MGTYVNKLLRKIMPMFYLIIKETYFLSASTMTKKQETFMQDTALLITLCVFLSCKNVASSPYRS